MFEIHRRVYWLKFFVKKKVSKAWKYLSFVGVNSSNRVRKGKNETKNVFKSADDDETRWRRKLIQFCHNDRVCHIRCGLGWEMHFSVVEQVASKFKNLLNVHVKQFIETWDAQTMCCFIESFKFLQILKISFHSTLVFASPRSLNWQY